MSEKAYRFSSHTLDHLTNLILGTPRSDDWQGPPPYRTGPEIERWVQQFVPEFVLGSAGRYRETRDEIGRLNETVVGRETVRAMMAAVLDPRDYAYLPEFLDEDIDSFNDILWFDRYRLVREPRSVRLEKLEEPHVLADQLERVLVELEWAIVSQDFRRMLENVDSDPEDAITAACALVESVCRSILVEEDVEIPKERKITTLYKSVARELGISADRDDFPSEVAEESKRILGSLAGTIAGIGHLRTKTGDAHGREHTARRVDPRIARLAVGSAATLSQFLIETWQRKAAES